MTSLSSLAGIGHHLNERHWLSLRPDRKQKTNSDQFLSTLGVSFSSGSPYVAAVGLGEGHATSGINGIGGTTPGGFLTYDGVFPIIATGDPPTASLSEQGRGPGAKTGSGAGGPAHRGITSNHHFFKNAETKSIGSGRKVVVLCSLAISRIVWR